MKASDQDGVVPRLGAASLLTSDLALLPTAQGDLLVAGSSGKVLRGSHSGTAARLSIIQMQYVSCIVLHMKQLLCHKLWDSMIVASLCGELCRVASYAMVFPFFFLSSDGYG